MICYPYAGYRTGCRGWCRRVSGLREIAAAFVAAAPAGARVRTRLRVSPADEAVLRAAGSHLGSLAGRDLAARCAAGRLDAKGRAVSRAARKRALTAQSSSRWAGAITRTSEDQWSLAERNLRADRTSLRARAGRIQARLAVPAGGRDGRVRGYATPAERHAKAIRLQSLKARLAVVGRGWRRGRCRWCGAAGHCCASGALLLPPPGWTRRNGGASGDSGPVSWTPATGEETRRGATESTAGIRTRAGLQQIRLPAPLALSRAAAVPPRPCRSGRRASGSTAPDEVAAQAATGAIRYGISHDPARDRWYRACSREGRLRRLFAGRLAAGPGAGGRRQPRPPRGGRRRALIGNILGAPATIGLLDRAGRPATARDGRLRAAISALIGTAKEHGARTIVIEDLDFAAARAEGRERHGSRPSRGRRGRAFRRLAFRRHPDREAPGRTLGWPRWPPTPELAVIVADPADSSRWGAEHWLAPLRERHPRTTGHHAAALVTGRRRGLGHRARRRAAGNRAAPEEAARPAQARPRAKPAARSAQRKPAAPTDPRQPPGAKTGRPHRTTAGDQAAQDRSRRTCCGFSSRRALRSCWCW